MTDLTLPPYIKIPAVIASSLKLAGPASARDISYAFAILHFVSQSGLQNDQIRLDDNYLRREVGQTRRTNIADEEARFDRLENTFAWADGMVDPAPLPTMPMRENGRWKALDGSYVWQVDPELADVFTPRPGELVVHFPTHLLRNARARFSHLLMLRILAWWSEQAVKKNEVVRNAEMLQLRFDPSELLRDFDLPEKMKPSDLFRDFIEPALEEINAHSDYYVESEIVRTAYKQGRVGRVRFIEFKIAPVDQPSVDEDFLSRAKAAAAERKANYERAFDAASTSILIDELGPKRKRWKRLPNARKKVPTPPPAPASIENVVSLPVDKTFDKFAQNPPSRARGFVMPPKHTRLSDGD